MREVSDLNELRKIELGILKEIHDFCVANNIQYYLACGTLIGAVRHNGFIPWDDDIDILMKRNDYEFFIHHFETERYGVNSCTTNRHYYWSYAKAYDKKTLKIENRLSRKLNQGVDVDIFILNECSDVNYALKKERKREIVKLLWRLSIYDRGGKRSLKSFFASCMSLFLRPFANKLAKMMNNLTMKDKKTKECASHFQVFSLVGNRVHIYEKEWFSEPVLHKFEGYEFFIPNGYDSVLKEEFGDYMVLPPIEQRITHHKNKVYWRD